MATKSIRFQLKGGARPINWQLPIRSVLISDGGIRKRIEYIRGHASPFKDDHKGDEKPESVWFKDGFLDVHPEDMALLVILQRHPLFKRKYELVDREAKAQEALDGYSKIEKALDKINISADDEAKATALVLVGPEMIGSENKEVRAALKKMAFESPDTVIGEMDKNDYRAKYSAALAIMREAVLVNSTHTEVTWPDGKLIVPVPRGKSSIDVLGAFLGENTPEARATLQEIGQQIKRSYIRNTPVTAEEEIKEILRDNDSKPEDNDVVLRENNDGPSGEDPDVEEARALYFDVLGNTVPHNKKNDVDWMLKKIDEKQNP